MLDAARYHDPASLVAAVAGQPGGLVELMAHPAWTRDAVRGAVLEGDADWVETVEALGALLLVAVCDSPTTTAATTATAARAIRRRRGMARRIGRPSERAGRGARSGILCREARGRSPRGKALARFPGP